MKVEQYRWNGQLGIWQFYEEAFGGWCTLRTTPHNSSSPMTLVEGIKHLINFTLARGRENQCSWFRDRMQHISITEV